MKKIVRSCRLHINTPAAVGWNISVALVFYKLTEVLRDVIVLLCRFITSTLSADF